MRISGFTRAFLAALIALTVSPLSAAPFTPGNVVVYRAGATGAALINTGNPVFLDEFSADGTLVQSIALPTAVQGANQPLITSGTATSEGLLSRSSDGRYLVLTGYGRALGGTGSLPSTSADAVKRIVGRVDADGIVDTTTALGDYASGNNPRSAGSGDGSGFWVGGGTGGVRYAALGASTSSAVSSTVANLRQMAVFNDQLYTSTSSGSAMRIAAIGSGTPIEGGQTAVSLPGLPISSGSPYAFALLDLDDGEPGVDTLYVADDGAGILKYTKSVGIWSAKGSVGSAADAYRGIAAIADAGSVTLFATRAGGSSPTGGGQLVKLVDASGYAGNLSGTPTLLATAATQTAFRGIALAPELAIAPPANTMRLTEWAYNGDEFMEFTNVGDAPVDMTGWKYDDDSADPAQGVDLSAFGVVEAGESVILAERSAADFRVSWGLCTASKIIGGSTVNLGRADQINLFDATGNLIDRLTYGDNTIGGPRTDVSSAWVSAAALGVDNVLGWTLSAANDGEASWASTTTPTFHASPGKSTRATVAFEACPPVVGELQISVDQPIVSGSIGDLHNPSAVVTVGGNDTALLTIAVASSNPSVITAAGVTISGSGTERNLSFAPTGRGVATLTLTVSDGTGASQSTTLTYASSNAAPDPSAAYYHRISDASGALDVGDDHVVLVNDETNTVFLHRASETGLPVNTWNFTAAQMGTSAEVDFEGIARSGNLVLITGSHGNNRSGSAKPERRTLIAATIDGSGATTELSFRGRYNNLWSELRSWDQGNGHGLGADALGFIAGTAVGVEPNPPFGFNIEGLEFAPDGTAAYLGFRAPTININGSYHALIVPLLNPAELTAAAPGTGPAQFGAPILIDLGGRSIRSIASNDSGDYLISAGPTPQNASWALYTWDGNPANPPQFNRELPAEDGLTGGTWESIGAVPHPLVEGAMVRMITDSGDTNFYGTGATKDLAAPYQKSYSQLFALAEVPVVVIERPAMRISEWMYDGDEFVEFTNVGDRAIDMTGWHYDDDSNNPALGVALGGFGIVAPGESVILAERDADAFRSSWNLCSNQKVIGNNTVGLGRSDQINLFDASGARVDRLTYGDNTIGGPRTQNRSAWVSAAALGNDNVLEWTLSTAGDAEGSVVSTSNAEHVASPGRSTQASVAFEACPAPTRFALSVAIGSGSGSVSGPGIACPKDCNETYDAGTKLVLTATPANGFVFNGWTGACSGTTQCALVMDAKHTVAAQFVAVVPPASDLSIHIEALGQSAALGQLLDYEVTVTNHGPDATTATAVSTELSSALDLTLAQWTCVGPVASGCTASGSGNLVDSGLSIPVGGSVTWVVSAPVRDDAGEWITSLAEVSDTQDNILGNNVSRADVPVVIFVDGFDSGVMPNALALSADSVIDFIWQPLAPQALIETTLIAKAKSSNEDVRLIIEALRGGEGDRVRLILRRNGEASRATQWIGVSTDMLLQLGMAEPDPDTGLRPVFLRAGAVELVIMDVLSANSSFELISSTLLDPVD